MTLRKYMFLALEGKDALEKATGRKLDLTKDISVRSKPEKINLNDLTIAERKRLVNEGNAMAQKRYRRRYGY